MAISAFKNNEMKLALHQPEHLIWLGLVHKISQVDLFVIVDTVQYRKDYFQNRNKIRTKNGWQWLTVPVKNHPISQKINEIEVSYERNWPQKYLKSLEMNYSKSQYFDQYYPKIREQILAKHKFLADLNYKLITLFLEWFEIKKKIFKSSEIGLSDIKGGGNNVVLEHCKKFKPKVYYSGIYGRNYLDLEDFKKSGIKVVFQDFRYPVYRQYYQPFIPNMSSLDLLFNYGGKSRGILLDKETPRMSRLE